MFKIMRFLKSIERNSGKSRRSCLQRRCPANSYSPREISTEDGTKLAHRILELYTKVMGGLQASHPPPWAQGEEMTKAPGEFEPPKPITKAERDARKASRKVDAEKAMTEHEITQKAFSANRERLKAERLTREAAGPPVAAKKAKTKKKPR